MLGYWRRPDEDAAVFRGDWFVSGDLVTFDDDGYVWFHGRADDVMNAGGYRVSPLEVEAALGRHPGGRRGRRRRARGARRRHGHRRVGGDRGPASDRRGRLPARILAQGGRDASPATSGRARCSSSTRCRAPPNGKVARRLLRGLGARTGARVAARALTFRLAVPLPI